MLPADVERVSIYPHAHYLAKEMGGTATLPDGTREAADLDPPVGLPLAGPVPLPTPLFLPKGTTLSMRFTYDNSAANPRNPQRPPQRVKWGPQSTDEMGALWLEVVPRRARTPRC